LTFLNKHKNKNCISTYRPTGGDRRNYGLHGVGYKWFSFLQGLEPSAVIPPQVLVAAREATQP